VTVAFGDDAVPRIQSPEILGPLEFLDGADVAPVFEKVGRKRVTEGMGGGSLGDPGTARRILHDAL